MFRLKNKGVTLIEVLISLAIFSIVMTAIFSFFITGYKSNNHINNELQIQDEGEKIVNFIVDKSIDGYGIENIYETENDSIIDEQSSNKVSKLIIKRKQNGTENIFYSVFEIKDNKIYYGEGNDLYKISYKPIGNYVECITLSSLPSVKNFKEADGIRIKVELKSKEKRKILINEVYFRNK